MSSEHEYRREISRRLGMSEDFTEDPEALDRLAGLLEKFVKTKVDSAEVCR